MHSAELETLDQLLGGEMSLAVIREVFENNEHFERAILAMLHNQDIRLFRTDWSEIASWEWSRILGDSGSWGSHHLSLTNQGAKRVS